GARRGGSRRLLALGRGQRVADAAHGPDERALAFVLELAAEPRHDDLEAGRGLGRGLAPDFFQEVVAGYHVAPAEGQAREDVELAAGQRHLPAPHPGLAAPEVDHDVRAAEDPLRRGLPAPAPPPAKPPPHPAE